MFVHCLATANGSPLKHCAARGETTPIVYQTPASHLVLLLPPLLMHNIKAETTPLGFIIDQDRDHFHKALILFGLM